MQNYAGRVCELIRFWIASARCVGLPAPDGRATPTQPARAGTPRASGGRETWVDQFRDACGGCIGLQAAGAACCRDVRAKAHPVSGCVPVLGRQPALRDAVATAARGHHVAPADGSHAGQDDTSRPRLCRGARLAGPAYLACPTCLAWRRRRVPRPVASLGGGDARLAGTARGVATGAERLAIFGTVAAVHAKRRNREPFATSIGCNGSIAAAIGAGGTAAALCQWQAASPLGSRRRRTPGGRHARASGNAARLWRRRRRHGLLESARLADRAPPGLWGRV